jgi:hypothetical protein
MAINKQWKLHQVTTNAVITVEENMPNVTPMAELIVANNRLHPLRFQSDEPTMHR